MTLPQLQFLKYGEERIVVLNKKRETLGTLTREFWNRWTWCQATDVIMSRGCLIQVTDYMIKLGGKP